MREQCKWLLDILRNRGYARCLLLFAFIFSVDFFSKAYVDSHIPFMSAFSSYPYGGIPLFNNGGSLEFSIIHVINRGAAWGLLSSWQTALLGARILLIGGMVIYLFSSPKAIVQRVPFILIIAGAVGNVADYFIYGYVIDMFHFKFWSYTYPIFNVADSSIFCGVVWLLWQSFQKKSQVISSS